MLRLNLLIWLMLAATACYALTQPILERIIYVDADAPGANNGSSWENAYRYLQDALADANSAVKPVEIRVAEGIYRPDDGTLHPGGTGDRAATFQLIDGVTLKGGYAGLNHTDPNARDIVKYKTILSGDLNGDDVEVADPCDLLTEPTRAENSYHVVVGSGTDATAILSGFTVIGGNANGSYPDNCGGGIYNYHGSPTLADCTITFNHAYGRGGGEGEGEGDGDDGGGGNGGGIYCVSGSSPRIENNNIMRNSAGNSGSGIHCDSNSSPTIENNNIEGNLAGNNGGGICCDESSPIISSNTITRNRSGDGAAIHCRAESSPTITNNALVENTANGEGGGIACHRNSTPLIENNTISNNTAHVGGGICCRESSPTIINNSITKNIADTGGGIRCNLAAPTVIDNTIIDNAAREDGGGINSIEGSSPTISNNIIMANTANDDGGGIHCRNCFATISHNTITANTADDNGGGVYCRYCSLTITNNVITRNTAKHGAGIACRDSSPVVTNNTISTNIAKDIGGAIRCQGSSSLTITNSILWGNTANAGAQITLTEGSELAVAYCDVSGGRAKAYVDPTSILVWSPTNINANPCFAAQNNGDYHLKSKAGRWNPNTQSWVKDNVTSPCIDAGDPNSDWTAELWPHGKRINMGAYGGHLGSEHVTIRYWKYCQPEQ